MRAVNSSALMNRLRSSASPWLHHTAELVRTLLPEIERMGVATAADIDVETLYERLQCEVSSEGSVIIGRSEIGAWSRV